MAQRATSLGPKPSLFFVFCLFFSFLSLLLIENPFFPKKAFLVIFQCLSLFCLSLFLPHPFSLYLSLSLSCSFLSSFLLVFLFCFLLVPCFCLFISFFLCRCFCFMKRSTSKLVSCLVFSFKSLFLIFFILIYVVFLVQHECF